MTKATRPTVAQSLNNCVVKLPRWDLKTYVQRTERLRAVRGRVYVCRLQLRGVHLEDSAMLSPNLAGLDGCVAGGAGRAA